jgi:hypothetical protein
MADGRIDHRLRRRALLADVAAGVRALDEVCDAPRDLVRAAVHLGTPRAESCPVCDRATLRNVAFVDDPRDPDGRGGRPMLVGAIAAFADRRGAVTVHDVEVCTACGWHHLLMTSTVRATLDAGVR